MIHEISSKNEYLWGSKEVPLRGTFRAGQLLGHTVGILWAQCPIQNEGQGGPARPKMAAELIQGFLQSERRQPWCRCVRGHRAVFPDETDMLSSTWFHTDRIQEF